MASQLIPPPEFAPPSVKHLPLEKRIEMWPELVDQNEALLLAGLRAKISPKGDLPQAYREWCERHIEEHDRMLIAFAFNLPARKNDAFPGQPMPAHR
jgi:hypothetical protein